MKPFPALALCTLAACAPTLTLPDAAATSLPDAGPVLPPASADSSRDILDTALALDLATRGGHAALTLAPSSSTGLSVDIGELSIVDVTLGGQRLHYQVVERGADGGPLRSRRLDVGVPATAEAPVVEVAYGFPEESAFNGWMPGKQLTFLWPYFCSNLFPCHPDPAEGSTFSLAVTGAPAGKTVIYPERIPAPAPSYMPAIAVGDYRYVSLGHTDAGTELGYYVLPTEDRPATATATAKLVELVDWYERTLGPYAFGPKMASVDVKWGGGDYGGMEHHPYFHVSSGAFGDENVHAHEAAHGWYGDSVRLRCWEDFVLSEGTTDYLAIRAVEVVRGATAAQAQWDIERQLLDQAVADGDTVAWPRGCGGIDIANDPLWSNIPYTKGAFFYRRVADRIGAAKLDELLGRFYRLHRGEAVGMGDMLAFLKAESGFDPTALANRYLRSLGNPEL